jgi:hypothetical protein
MRDHYSIVHRLEKGLTGVTSLTQKCERNIEDEEEHKDDNEKAWGRSSRQRRNIERMRKRAEVEIIFSLVIFRRCRRKQSCPCA